MNQSPLLPHKVIVTGEDAFKFCPACEEFLPLSDFYLDIRNISGRRADCKKCWLEESRNYDHTLKNANTRQRNAAVKQEAVSKYGGKCFCCGEMQIVFLSIDHIGGGGNKQRREIGIDGGVQFYYWLRRNNWPTGYRAACHNCNMATHILGKCPHVKVN